MGAILRTALGQVPIVAADVFTATSTQGSAVSLIQITNVSASNRAVTVTISNDGSTYRTLAYAITVPTGTAVGILTGTLNLANNGRIRLVATSGSAGDLEYVISSLDYS